MRVRDVMTKDVIGIGPEAALKEAARRMITASVSGLVVADDQGSLVGVISEADFVKTEAGRRADTRAGLLRWLFPAKTFPDSEQRVGDVMTTDPVTIGPDADHAEAARLMGKARVKRLPVVDHDGKLVGIISRSDILRVFARSDAEIVAEIRDRVIRDVLWIDPKPVKIVCDDGNVILSGLLETKSDADLLVGLTRRLDGVVSIQDHLTWAIDNTRVEMVSPVPAPPQW